MSPLHVGSSVWCEGRPSRDIRSTPEEHVEGHALDPHQWSMHSRLGGMWVRTSGDKGAERIASNLRPLFGTDQPPDIYMTCSLKKTVVKWVPQQKNPGYAEGFEPDT